MNTTDAGIRQLKNGNWAYRFSISVNGQKISQRGSTNSEGQPLKTKTDAIRARKKAIKLAQLAPLLPVKEKEPEKLTVAQVFDEYREKGRSDRAYNTILKQDSMWLNHLQEAFGSRILEEIEVAEITDYLANEWVHMTNWDLVIFDEYHFGAWKENAKKLFEQDEDDFDDTDLSKYNRGDAVDETWLPITTNYYLFLSGTPFWCWCCY